MSVETWANTSFRHAKYALVIGMSNQPQRVAETGGWSGSSVKIVRAKSHSWVNQGGNWVLSYSREKHVSDGANMHEKILATAKRAESYRAGNCGEHAAVVYAFLHEKARGKNIGLVSRISCRSPGDHAFVVINRDSGGDGSAASWGADSVLVDAWGGFVCKGSDVNLESGQSIYAADGIGEEDVRRVQHYIKHYDVTIRCEFSTA